MTAAPAVQRARGWWRRTFVEPDAARVAVEVRAGALGLVRVEREGTAVTVAGAAQLELHPGVVGPGLAPGNVRDAEALRAALRAALERTGTLGGGPVALVLPDATSRISLVPRSEVAAGTRAETEEILRFKLRKTLPFDVRDARLDYAVHEERRDAPVLVTVAQAAVVREYESVCEDEGLQPGRVLPASLALAEALSPQVATGEHLLLNWEESSAVFVLFREGWPALVRTFTGGADLQPEGVARELASTAVYLTERLGGRGLDRVHVRAGSRDPEQALAALRGVDAEVRLVDPWTPIGGAFGPLHQPLAAAAAVLAAGSLVR